MEKISADLEMKQKEDKEEQQKILDRIVDAQAVGFRW